MRVKFHSYELVRTPERIKPVGVFFSLPTGYTNQAPWTTFASVFTCTRLSETLLQSVRPKSHKLHRAEFIENLSVPLAGLSGNISAWPDEIRDNSVATNEEAILLVSRLNWIRRSFGEFNFRFCKRHESNIEKSDDNWINRQICDDDLTERTVRALTKLCPQLETLLFFSAIEARYACITAIHTCAHTRTLAKVPVTRCNL